MELSTLPERTKLGRPAGPSQSSYGVLPRRAFAFDVPTSTPTAWMGTHVRHPTPPPSPWVPDARPRPCRSGPVALSLTDHPDGDTNSTHGRGWAILEPAGDKTARSG
jgi:hypothetical protein